MAEEVQEEQLSEDEKALLAEVALIGLNLTTAALTLDLAVATENWESVANVAALLGKYGLGIIEAAV